MELHIIFNPLANHGKAPHLMSRLERYMKHKNIKYRLHATQYASHATDIARELTADKKRKLHIVSVGGDGTANEILNGIMHFENLIFSIVPAGSGNDFIKNFKFDYSDPVETLKRQIENQNKWRYIDFIDVNNGKVRSLNVLGCGIDTDILERYNSKKWFSPKYRYKMATIEKALNFNVHDVSYKKDNNKIYLDREILVVEICNGKYFGGSLIASNYAKVDDGFLTVSYVRNFNRIKTIPYMQHMLKFGIDKLRSSNWFHCKQIILKMKRPVYQVDGQLKTDTNTLKIKCVSNKLKFVA